MTKKQYLKPKTEAILVQTSECMQQDFSVFDPSHPAPKGSLIYRE